VVNVQTVLIVPNLYLCDKKQKKSHSTLATIFDSVKRTTSLLVEHLNTVEHWSGVLHWPGCMFLINSKERVKIVTLYDFFDF